MNDPQFRDNPWSAPAAKPPSSYDDFGTFERPQVVVWFYVYCAFMALLYLLVGLFMTAGMLLPPDRAKPEEVMVVRIVGGVFVLICFGLGALFGAAPFLTRRPWVWVYDIVLIAVGLTSCALWPATIPLLIFWLKPETKRHFGRPAV